MGRPLHTLTPAEAEEVQELARRLRDIETEADKIQEKLVRIAGRRGASAVAREARKVLGKSKGVSRQSLEKRIAGRSE